MCRSVLGATLSVSLGLFTVALCHYLGVARLMLALSSTEPSSYTWMYPALDIDRREIVIGSSTSVPEAARLLSLEPSLWTPLTVLTVHVA